MTKYQNQKTKMTMHINIVLMGIGFYMLLPYLNNHLITTKGLAAVIVGYLASVRSLSSDVSMVFFGALGDKIGCKKTMIMGVGARVVGFMLFGYADILINSGSGMIILYGIAGALIGAGGALFLPACTAYYDAMSTEENRAQMFSLHSMLDRSGDIFGPAMGSFIMMAGGNFRILCTVCAITYIVSIVITVLFLPELKREVKEGEKVGVITTIIECARNKKFVFFLLCTSVLAFITMQQALTIPVKIDQINPGYTGVGMIYTVAAIISVVLQMPLVTFMKKHFNTYTIFSIATVLYIIGIVMMGFSGSITLLYVGAAFYAVGGALHMPVKSLTMAEFAGRGKVAGYYGFQGLVGTIVNTLANVIGGALYDFAKPKTGALFYSPWIIFGIVGVLIVIFFLFLAKRSQITGSIAELPKPAPIKPSEVLLEEELDKQD